jgi:6-phosphogluconolactonase
MADVRVFAGADELAEAVAKEFVDLATTAIADRDRFAVALAGGSTPRAAYTRLASEPYASRVDWSRVLFLWGDERCVPPDHLESNYRMAREALLARVPLPEGNVHRPRAEIKPEDAAVYYEHDLRLAFDLGAVGFPRFDLIWLGMGSNGHTASLFPGNPTLDENVRLFVATHVPELDADRLTLTSPVINHAAQVIFLVVGEGKAETLREVLEGERDPARLPAQLVRPDEGRVTWLLDEAAARLLSR